MILRRFEMRGKATRRRNTAFVILSKDNLTGRFQNISITAVLKLQKQTKEKCQADATLFFYFDAILWLQHSCSQLFNIHVWLAAGC